MRRNTSRLALLAGVTFLLAGCEAAKSSNPTSPSVAGPIPGVNITTPRLLEPGPNWAIESTKQPITLLIENASTNGQRTVSYVFEVAADVEFSTKVFAREGVPPGTEGRTSLRLPDALTSDRTYYWRAKATDGANSSDYTPAAAFNVVTPAVIEAPTPLAPVGGVTLTSTRADFVIRNSVKSGPTGQINYIFDISLNESFTSMVAVVTIPETAVETRLSLSNDLPYKTRFFWRVRAHDENTSSPYTATQTFLTPDPPPPPPPPAPTPGPGPSPTPPPSGWPRNGAEVVDWATRNYPDRLVAGVSLSQRQNNMAFVRDRMIEAGLCGGMDLAWNMKRGGPERSIDYLAYRKGGTWIGVDIGLAYDDTGIPLRLQWGENPGDPYVSPATYSPYPSCK